MLRIGAGLSSADHAAQKQVRNALDRLREASVKLATLSRINRGSDDPAGMVAAQALSDELHAIEQASAAAERTRALVHVADSGLARAGELLDEIHANVVAAANQALSPDEKRALQGEIDAALESLDRVGRSTSFAGKKLLNGESLSFLAGPSASDRATLVLPNVNSGSLASANGSLDELRSGGGASVTGGNLEWAVDILHAAQTEINSARADAGALERHTIDAAQALLADVSVNLSGALSQIADTDVARQSANLVQSMVLADTAIAAAKLTAAAGRQFNSLPGDLFEKLA